MVVADGASSSSVVDAGDSALSDGNALDEGQDAGPPCGASAVLAMYDCTSCIESNCGSQLEACNSKSCQSCVPLVFACAAGACAPCDAGEIDEDASTDGDAGCDACQTVAQCCSSIAAVYGDNAGLICTSASSDCANELSCQTLLATYSGACP
jgi:hypothetical protein